MSVPKGYKETKVGIVPEDWKETPLSSFIHEKIGYCNDEKVNLGSLTIENGVIPKPAQYKREHLVKDTTDAYKLVEYSDFAYNPMNLRFGALALYLRQEQLKVSSYYNIFNIDKNIVDIDYIYAYLKSERIMFHYNRMATGSLEEKKRVHFKEFKKFIFPLPPLKEQQKIAQILTTWDDAISKQESLIEVKEELKKGLMQKLLNGEVRFDGFDEEWKEVRLDKVLFHKVRAVDKPKEGYWRLGLRSHAKGTFHAFVEDPSTVSMDTLYDVKENDLIVNITFAWEHALALASKNDEGKLVSHRFPTYVFKSEHNSTFFRYYMLQPRFKYELINISPGGAGRNRVMSKKDFLKLKTIVPSLQEQQKIAKVLSFADKEIDLLNNELEVLTEQKRGLMQRLLSGEVRTNKIREIEN